MAMNLRLFSETALTSAVRSAQIVPPAGGREERSFSRVPFGRALCAGPPKRRGPRRTTGREPERTERGVLDVGALDDLARRQQEGRSDSEVRVWRVGALAGCGFDRAGGQRPQVSERGWRKPDRGRVRDGPSSEAWMSDSYCSELMEADMACWAARLLLGGEDGSVERVRGGRSKGRDGMGGAGRHGARRCRLDGHGHRTLLPTTTRPAGQGARAERCRPARTTHQASPVLVSPSHPSFLVRSSSMVGRSRWTVVPVVAASAALSSGTNRTMLADPGTLFYSCTQIGSLWPLPVGVAAGAILLLRPRRLTPPLLSALLPAQLTLASSATAASLSFQVEVTPR